MVTAPAVGATFAVHETSGDESLSERLRPGGATFGMGAPTNAVDLVSELDAAAPRLNSIERSRLSEAPGSRHVVQALTDHGTRPQRGYGVTEAGSPHEEDLAKRHEAISTAAAIPIPDDRLGEGPCFVMAHNGRHVGDAELLAEPTAGAIAQFDLPELTARSASLPPTASVEVLERAPVDAGVGGDLRPEPVVHR